MRLVTRVVVVMGLLAAGARFAPAQTPPPPQGPPRTPPLLMTTTAFDDGGVIPNKYTGAATGTPVSPELKWSQVPPGTQSFVLFL
ncbi:MAG: hypothetical protein ABUS56_03025, partial [Acidobacteriota bacterium]